MARIDNLVRYEETTLAPAAIASSGGVAGNTLYSALPGDGTIDTVPAQATPDTLEPTTFDVATSFTVIIATYAARIRVSADGSNFGDWIVLEPGIYSFDLSAMKVQISRYSDGSVGSYQLVFFR